MRIKIVCSWCGCFIGWKKCEFFSKDENPYPITHSICSECFDKEMAKIEAVSINKNNIKKGTSS